MLGHVKQWGDLRYDDVGSFPLPDYIDKEVFNEFYWMAYKAILNEIDINSHRGIYNNIVHPVLQSFQQKLNAGVEIINYPQHMDMYSQFLKPMTDFEMEPDLIDPKKAIIPEMVILDKFAEEYHERTGFKLNVKICITGPIELYIKKHDFTIYLDMALNISKSINHFIKNSLINTKYLETSIVAIDEPSFGYVDVVNVSDDDLIQIFDKSLEGISSKVDTQIHLHSLKRASIPLQTKEIDVLTCEYASDKTNIIPKRELDQHDKFIRVGITRTNLNRILADELDAGKALEEFNSFEGMMGLIDSKEQIEKNLRDAITHYDDRLKHVGPDCGLGGWQLQQVAFELLHRTFQVVKKVKSEL